MNQTIKYYNTFCEKYIEDTYNNNMQNIYLRFLNSTSKVSLKILDLGCGSGRDSKFFLNKGYEVTAIDASEQMCKITSEIIGQKVLCLEFEKICYDNEFDAIWASASLLHLSPNKLLKVFNKLIMASKNEAIIYLSFKEGNFKGIREERYYCDLTEEELNSYIKKFKELILLDLWINIETTAMRENTWLNAIIKVNKLAR